MKRLLPILTLVFMTSCDSIESVIQDIFPSDDSQTKSSVLGISDTLIEASGIEDQTFTIYVESTDWTLSPVVMVDDKEYIGYNIDDESSIPNPITTYNTPATYGVVNQSTGQEEIVKMEYSLVDTIYSDIFEVNKISANELEITVMKFHDNPEDNSRTIVFELISDGFSEFITFEQSAGDYFLCGTIPELIGVSVNKLRFNKDGGEYVITSDMIDWWIPTCGAMYIADSFSQYYIYESYVNDGVPNGGIYPEQGLEENGYIYEAPDFTYGTISDGRGVEEVISASTHLYTITKTAADELSISLEANDTGNIRYIYINLITEYSPSFITCIRITQSAE